MLIRAPESWPQPLVAVVAMLALAALDLGGAVVAKEAVLRRSPLLVGAGVAIFVMLFWVYASSLQYAELAPVTFGWVVLLQVGVLLLDRYRYATHLPAGTWVAVTVILLAQAYLLFGAQPGPAPKDAGSVHPRAMVEVVSAAPGGPP